MSRTVAVTTRMTMTKRSMNEGDGGYEYYEWVSFLLRFSVRFLSFTIDIPAQDYPFATD